MDGFWTPSTVGVDDDEGSVYVGDRENKRIQIVKPRL